MRSRLVHVEGKAQRRTALPDAFAVLRHLFGRTAVLMRQMFGDAFTFGHHLRVQFERLKMNIRRHIALYLGERLLQGLETDRAPGADDVGKQNRC